VPAPIRPHLHPRRYASSYYCSEICRSSADGRDGGSSQIIGTFRQVRASPPNDISTWRMSIAERVRPAVARTIVQSCTTGRETMIPMTTLGLAAMLGVRCHQYAGLTAAGGLTETACGATTMATL
jgi:hypothetical protein